MIIKRFNNPNNIHFPATMIHGDCGYNKDECYDLIDDTDMEFSNTTKRLQLSAFKFGMTWYNTLQEQRDIPENGPVLSLGAVRSIDDAICHFGA
jgi:hypothetical protein